MKQLSKKLKLKSLSEALKISSKSKVNNYNYFPKDKKELIKLVNKLIKERGNDCDLNDIDVSHVRSFATVFYELPFDGNISKWDVSNATSMMQMFAYSAFTGKNGDISNWNVSKVKDMSEMFANSFYDGDLSKWNVSKVENIDEMFTGSKFTGKHGDIGNWDVSNVRTSIYTFCDTRFDGDLYNWNMPKNGDMDDMFKRSPLEKCPPIWYEK